MAYNRNLVSSTRSVRDTVKKQEYRRGKFENLPRIMQNQLTNGVFRIRLMPSDTKKNPHGYLDYRVHKVPLGHLIDGQDARFVKMQCPRSSNWDPATVNPETGEEHYTERCAICELDEWVFNTPWDPDDPEGQMIIDNLPEGLKEIIGKLDFRANSWDSGVYIPCIMQAKIHTHTKEEDANDPTKSWDRYTYCPGGSEDFLPCLLKLRHPDFSERFDENGIPMQVKNGLQEQFFNFISNCPDADDLQFGRWVTITKINDGIGGNGYSFGADPYPSPFPADKVEDVYKKLYAFPQWGDKTKKKPTTRMPYEQQVALIANADWADDLRRYDVPITDADVETLERGLPLVADEPSTHTPGSYVPPHQVGLYIQQSQVPPPPVQPHPLQGLSPATPPQYHQAMGNTYAAGSAFPLATSAAIQYPSNPSNPVNPAAYLHANNPIQVPPGFVPPGHIPF